MSPADAPLTPQGRLLPCLRIEEVKSMLFDPTLLHMHPIRCRWRPRPTGSAWSFQPTEPLLAVEAGQGNRSRKVMGSRTWRAQ